MFRYTSLTAVREISLWLIAILYLLPFFFVISMALKDDSEVFATSPFALPESPSLSSFEQVLSGTGNSDVLAGLMNSIIMTGGSVLCLILLGSLAGYVISRTASPRWSRSTYYLFLVGIILPPQLATVPLYMGATTLGLTGSAWGMIVLYTGMMLPLATFLYAGFFRGLGTEYEEAALIDGASRGQIFFRVVLPLMSPATGTVAILGGLIIWNDFFTALVFLGGSQVQTLPVAMYYYVGSLVSQWNQIFAIVIISMVPILALYMFAQKKFIQGFAGGLKG